MSCKQLVFFFLFWGWMGTLLGQTPEYLMSDTTVTDCDGFLFDSGDSDDIYGNNENFTFTVETGGVAIEVSFLNEVCIEPGFDFLYIYDGTSDAAPQLAEISGFGLIPPSVTATSGAVTFVFTSDQSAGYCGFEIFWDTIVGPPEPPVPTAIAPNVCGTSSFNIAFSYPIECDWLSADSISVVGSGPIGVNSATLNCSNGTGTLATIGLDQPIDYNCDFQVLIQMGIPDVCDSVWIYTLVTSFTVDVCDVNGGITASETEICEGSCVELEAFALGCNAHSFSWNQALPPTEGPHSVCPSTTTTYQVTITDDDTGNSTVESVTIFVTESQIEFPDTTLCQSEPPFLIPSQGTATGFWEGPGIQDPEIGLFVPDSANAGVNVVYFISESLCTDSVLITIEPIQSGDVLAACPGSPAFLLEPEPPGGIWEGIGVSPEGLFDPTNEGSFDLIYTLNGCQDTLLMNVADIAGQFVLDTLCQSNWADTIPFSPLGGVWSGPGIIDTLFGVFDPHEVAPGLQLLNYSVEGCDQQFEVFVKEVFVGQRFRSSCPEQNAFIPQPNFAPPGGFWEGAGLVNTATGMYDPGSIPNDFWTDLIYYAPNGCTDTISYYNRQTEIPIDTLWFCLGNDAFLLNNETVGRTPFGGEWLGAGITYFDDDFYFIPALAGNQSHTITYTANGCLDTLVMMVHPDSFEVPLMTFCSNEAPELANPALNPGGTWSGQGIADASSGLFDPALSGAGSHTLFWTTPAGCYAEVYAEVEVFQQATLNGLTETYCFESQDFPLTVSPAGGVLTGNTGDFSFNPAVAGEGSHVLAYSYTGQYCTSDTSISVFVFPSLALELEASQTVVCINGGSVLTGTPGGGGDDTFYTFSWSDGLFPVSSNSVSPAGSQWYYLTLADGCSDPVTDSVFIEVLPPIQPLVTLSDTLCFGETGGFAAAEVTNAGSFTVSWEGPGEASGNTITANAGSVVALNVIDDVYGCTFDSLVLVPSYTPVSALFSTNPNADCIPFDNQPVEFIDFSQFGITGLWDLGNGETAEYTAGERIFASFEQAGDYTASLILFNEGGCEASFELGVCILPPTPIFIPDIFSPNDDGLNDVLFVRGLGIESMQFEVYDRWGERVFESQHPDNGWDGRFRGRTMPSGAYTWVLKARLNNGKTDSRSGTVRLVR